MRRFENGFWGTVDQWLQRVGRAVVCAISRRGRSAEDVACAVLGGCLLCAIFGAVIGFVLSDLSHNTANLSRSMVAVEGGTIGLLLGACVGVFFGSFVDSVDQYIRNLLHTLSPK
jgi:hypothetical protein